MLYPANDRDFTVCQRDVRIWPLQSPLATGTVHYIYLSRCTHVNLESDQEMSRHGGDESDTVDTTNLSASTEIESMQLSGTCWKQHHSYIPIPTTYYHPKSPWLLCRPEAVIPEPYPFPGCCLSSCLSCLRHPFPQHLPSALDGIISYDKGPNPWAANIA